MKQIVKKFFSVLTAGVMLCSSQIATAYDTAAPETEPVLKAVTQADSGDVKQIELNTDVTDSLTSSSDVNYYQFTLTEYGYINIDFSHAYIDKSYTYWMLNIYDSNADANLIWSGSYKGNEVNADPVVTRSLNLGLEKGTYIIKVTDYYYSDIDYTLKVNFTKDPNWETELNDSLNSADQLELNSNIAGSLRNEQDIDWFTFDITEYGFASIDFSHAFINNNSIYWMISVYDTTPSGNLIWSGSYKGNEINADPVVKRSMNLGLEKGTYAIKITDYYYSGIDYTLKVNFTKNPNWETELNDSLNSADKLELNSNIAGSLRSEQDIDWYTFDITEYGFASIDFSHAFINNNSTYWMISVYDTTPSGNLIWSGSYKGNEINADPVVTRSVNLGLEKGTYAIKITDYYYSGIDYTLKVNFTKNPKWETELNDSLDSADQLELNSNITGSLRSEKDIDWYTFTLPEDGIIYLDFSHAYTNNSSTYWTITLFDSTPAGNKIYTQSYKGNSQNANPVTESSSGITLNAGTYRIQIVDYYYSSLDYMLSVRNTDESSYIVTTTTPPAFTTTTTTTTTTKATTTTTTTKKTTTTTTTKKTTTTTTTKKTTTTTTTKKTTTSTTTKKTTTTTTTKKTTTTTTTPITTTDVSTTTTANPVIVNSGDINCDGEVNQTDVDLMIDLLAGKYMPSVRGYANADINGDQNIDSDDLKLLVSMINASSTMPGDVDCNRERDVADAVLLARFLAEDKDASITQQGQKNADCNKSGKPDPDDVVLILKAIARLITL